MAVFVKYPSPPSSGTFCVSFEIGSLVPEPTKLEYEAGSKRLIGISISPISLFSIYYPDWYPSLVDSGTSQSTLAHQAWVPSWIFFEKRLYISLFSIYLSRLVPELGGLGYFTSASFHQLVSLVEFFFVSFFFKEIRKNLLSTKKESQEIRVYSLITLLKYKY